MCMTYDEKATKRFRAKMKNNGGKVRCWKVWIAASHRLSSPMWPLHAGGQVRRAGIVISDRRRRRGTYKTGSHVNKGFHVFRTENAARAWGGVFRECVPVICELRNFVGAGSQRKGQRHLATAVFTKVRLLRKDFDAAVKGNGNA